MEVAHEPMKKEAVRIVGIPAAVFGHVRAVDGDTPKVSGTRIRLLRFDVSESEQSCRPGGRGQSCGYEATRTDGPALSPVKSLTGTAMAESRRFAASPGWNSSRGWSQRMGRSSESLQSSKTSDSFNYGGDATRTAGSIPHSPPQRRTATQTASNHTPLLRNSAPETACCDDGRIS